MSAVETASYCLFVVYLPKLSVAEIIQRKNDELGRMCKEAVVA
jgi:hypothetical protein